jgi:hypothetical protein
MLTLQDLLELETIREALANFAVRVGELRDKARPKDDADSKMKTALRLSRVENAFYVLDGVLEDTCAEAKSDVLSDHSREYMTSRHKMSWAKKTLDA